MLMEELAHTYMRQWIEQTNQQFELDGKGQDPGVRHPHPEGRVADEGAQGHARPATPR